MNVRYRITLTTEERAELEGLIGGGRMSVRRIKRAQILLAADSGSSDDAISRHVSVGTSTVYRTKRRFVEEGLAAALSEEPRPGAERKLTTHEEAILVAVVCSDPPRCSVPLPSRQFRARDSGVSCTDGMSHAA